MKWAKRWKTDRMSWQCTTPGKESLETKGREKERQRWRNELEARQPGETEKEEELWRATARSIDWKGEIEEVTRPPTDEELRRMAEGLKRLTSTGAGYAEARERAVWSTGALRPGVYIPVRHSPCSSLGESSSLEFITSGVGNNIVYVLEERGSA
jgi:hypothetical protein